MTNVERQYAGEGLKLDVAVIGAGIIGLAVARAFAMEGREVIVFETEPGIGMHTSSRNSEVIHSGIYYPETTPLKAALCVDGRVKLYEYCEANGVKNKKIGKLLVALTESEIPKLEGLKKQGEKNGVNDLEWIDQKDVKEFEPLVSAVLGLFSPSTGIVDSHGLMESLKRDCAKNKTVIMTSAPVIGGKVKDNGVELILYDGDQTSVLCRTVVNCAGLWASTVANSIKGLPKKNIPATYFAKGHYFTINGKPFSHLVYPMPVAGGLGVHVTLDIEGNIRFGPDVQWTNKIDYSFDNGREGDFYTAIRKYLPSLQDGSLQPGYTGIRPKLARQKEPDRDFVISGPKDHGIDGLINLFGIESPGLTASLAIAERVRSELI